MFRVLLQILFYLFISPSDTKLRPWTGLKKHSGLLSFLCERRELGYTWLITKGVIHLEGFERSPNNVPGLEFSVDMALHSDALEG